MNKKINLIALLLSIAVLQLQGKVPPKFPDHSFDLESVFYNLSSVYSGMEYQIYCAHKNMVIDCNDINPKSLPLGLEVTFQRL